MIDLVDGGRGVLNPADRRVDIVSVQTVPRCAPRPSLAAGGQSGFTLLELLVVVAVLGVLSGVVVFSVGAMTERAEQSACAADERVLVTALEAHAASTGSYVDQDALVAAGHLRSASSSHEVVLSADDYSIVPAGDCAPGSGVEVAAESGSAALVATTSTLPPTTTTTAPPEPTEATSTITSVAAVNLSTNKWRATATVRVTDDLGGAVSGAQVALEVEKQGRTGKWTGLAGTSGTTDDAGVTVVSSVDVNKYPVAGIRFRVTSVSAPGLDWKQDDTWVGVTRP